MTAALLRRALEGRSVGRVLVIGLSLAARQALPPCRLTLRVRVPYATGDHCLLDSRRGRFVAEGSVGHRHLHRTQAEFSTQLSAARQPVALVRACLSSIAACRWQPT